MVVARLYRERSALEQIRSGISRILRAAAQLVWIAALALSLSTLVSESVYWLHDGHWPAWSVDSGLRAAGLSVSVPGWQGADILMTGALTIPAPVGMALVGLVVAATLAFFGELVVPSRS